LALAGPVGAVEVLQKYEESLVAQAMRAHGLELETEPEGKTIEAIVVHEYDVLLGSDFTILNPVPIVSRFRALNKLHVRTREYIVRQELLFSKGDTFRRDIYEETGRNLRSMFILAMARTVICKGSSPDKIKILIVTKDNWTLRLNTNFYFDQARLDQLSFSISENNLAGRNKTISLNFAFDPGRYAVGLSYGDPRVWSSRHAASAGAGIFINREVGNYEGFSVAVGVGRPLFSLRSKWAWRFDASWLQDIFRDYREGTLRAARIGDEVIPRVWNRQERLLELSGTRSFGVKYKINLTLGWRVSSTQYTIVPELVDGISPVAIDLFQRFVMPRSEDAIGPFFSLSAFSAKFVRMQNIHTFALSEDFRVGPAFGFEARYSEPSFGLGYRFLNLSASYSDVRWYKGALFALAASAAMRIQNDVWPGTSMVNEDVQIAARHITPRFGPFRVHVFGSLRLRNHDLFHSTLTIGGDSGLRAFPARAFPLSASTGSSNRYQVNVELRSVALNLWTVHIGGVLFYDGGDAPLSLLNPGWHHGAGVGVRILFPQFNRDVLRLDLAFPFEEYPPPGSGFTGTWSPRFTAEFGQAF
jgi:hypothetical protein